MAQGPGLQRLRRTPRAALAQVADRRLRRRGLSGAIPAAAACPACDAPDASPAFEKLGLAYRRCAGCGLLFARPRAVAVSYEDPAYFEALSLETRDPDLLAMKQATARSRLAILRSAGAVGALLEIGCGTGHFIEAAGGTAVGVDVSRTALGMARRRAARVVQALPDRLPFGAATFDAVAIYDTLEHLLDPRGALRESARLLRDGGLLHVTTPDVDGLPARLLGRGFPHVNPEHVSLFGRRSLRGLLASEGFEVRSLRSVQKPLSLAYLRSRLDRYRTPLATPIVRALAALLPGFARRPMMMPSGEIEALATKGPVRR